MAKRQQKHEELDEQNMDMNNDNDTEDRDARGRFTSEGGHDQNLDDEDMDTKRSTPPKKK